MTKEEKQILVKVLQSTINLTDDWFKTKEHSDAYIIGYLQGALKSAISELK
jgi:hypothetical protein